VTNPTDTELTLEVTLDGHGLTGAVLLLLLLSAMCASGGGSDKPY